MILAAYGWGYREGILAAVVTAVGIGVVDGFSGVADHTIRSGVLASVVVLLAAFVGGFTRQLWIEAESRQQESLDQVTRLTLANDLLHALHDVVQTLPASLDLSEVVSSARDTFRERLDATAIVVLVPEETENAWRVELADGTRMEGLIPTDELPRVLQRALANPGVVRATDLATEEAASPEARSVLATALRAQDRVVGLVSIENREPGKYDEKDASLLEGLASSLALAVDNARYFARLRTLGAEAERARIARDLHDRIAQSLAYVGFELDRLATSREDTELRELHGVVRGVVAELRETLYELRATVSEDQHLAEIARGYLDRWSKRTGVQSSLRATSPARHLPLQVEQELWRILQESLTNVERHADASRVWITWEIASDMARLEISDDGRGMDTPDTSRERYGLVGIRERADSVGAHVTLTSEPGKGTRVLVELEAKE